MTKVLNIITTILLFGELLILCQAHVKLNVPRVRLPYFDQLSVNFTLKVGDLTPGCYQWSVSRSDIISIHPQPNEKSEQAAEYEGKQCSDTAIISTVPRVSPCCPANAIVYAEDLFTQETVRCDVVIDKITSISIVSTTKELHLEEAPSKFQVRGYGSKNNEFSTLDGVPIKWYFEVAGAESTSFSDSASIMRFMPFSESSYKAPPGVGVLEAERKQGSTVLVEGIKTGSSNVTARIVENPYKDITSSVRILVVANLILEPSEIYVLPGTNFDLKLLQMKHGKIIDIKLPNMAYEFSVENDTVVKYDHQYSVVTTAALGDTTISVKDLNCAEELNGEHSRDLTALIHVREPRFLSLTINPYRNWAVIIGQEYEIQVDLYDSDNQKITIGENNVVVDVTFDKFFFEVSFSSKNGTYHIGKPVRKGVTSVKAVLSKVKDLTGSFVEPPSAIRVKAEMEIYQTVVINPKEVVLPWDPIVQPHIVLRWNPSGGSGSFVWRTTNASVVTVTQSGTGRTEYIGFANVTAASSVNQYMKGHSKVYVLPPVSMSIIDHIVEAEVNIPIQVPLAFYGIRPDDPTKTPVPYSSCGTLPIKVEVEDPNFNFDSKTRYPHMKPACTVLPITGTTLGSSLVTVSYTLDEQTFTDSVTVSTFKPLQVLEPKKSMTVLAVGSSKQIVFEGGPRPLFEKHAGFYRRLNVANKTVVAQANEVKIEQSVKDDVYIYEVLCSEIGETDVAFEIGNSIATETSKPVSRVAIVSVVCAEPASMYFKVETELKTKCPTDASSTQVVRVAVPNYASTLVAVTVKDAHGRKFDNITSLAIQWSSSSTNLVDFENLNFVITEPVETNDGYYMTGKSYQKINALGRSGNVVITAEIKGYRNDVLKSFGIKPMELNVLSQDDEEESMLETVYSMDLHLVGDVKVSHPTVTVFNHPSVEALVRVKEGSGHFQIETIGSSVVGVEYMELNRTIALFPSREGNARVLVKDLCLSTPVAEIDVEVNGIGLIHVEILDKLQLAYETGMSVHIYDRNGVLLPAEVLSLLKLKLQAMNSDTIEISPVSNTFHYQNDRHSSEFTTTDNQFSFKVRGINVGTCTITFSVDPPSGIGKEIRSTPKQLNVFPPLTLKPRNLTLLVGSLYQLAVTGGPQPDAITDFYIENKTVVYITPNGVVQGRVIGDTTIRAKSRDKLPQSKTYSEDVIIVRVVPLEAIKIEAPLIRLETDTEMPLWITGIGQDHVLEPSVLLGGLEPLGRFEWTTSNNETGEISSLLQNVGYTPSPTAQLRVHLKTKQAGFITVSVKGTFPRGVFNDNIQIEVYDQLKFLHSQTPYPVLMSPNSELSLKTNRGGKSLYKLFPISPSDKNVVTIDSSGIARSNDALGQVIVSVTLTEDSGDVQSLTILIQVKQMSYVLINLPPLEHLSELEFKEFVLKEKPVVPRGINFPMVLSYHDNVGRKFHSTNINPRVRGNRFDLVQVSRGDDNGSFVLQTLTEGRICLRVADGNMRDYLLMEIADWTPPVEEPPTDVALKSETSPDTDDNLQDTSQCRPVEISAWSWIWSFIVDSYHIWLTTPVAVFITLWCVSKSKYYLDSRTSGSENHIFLSNPPHHRQSPILTRSFGTLNDSRSYTSFDASSPPSGKSSRSSFGGGGDTTVSPDSTRYSGSTTSFRLFSTK